nr:DUF2515 domain-containing protein [Bacillus marasmi]
MRLNNIPLSSYKLSYEEEFCLRKIKEATEKKNVDNISRTRAYFVFFETHPDINWAFLASMVSRNGGWNMCDLEGKWFPRALPKKLRTLMFLTFERANWLIFQDAFPQLLLYHYSTKMGQPMFHLLRFFYVSGFMEAEWNNYWRKRDGKRLMTSLIINEQNVIQHPVIEQPVFKKKVFHSFPYNFQDWFHFSSVIFPTLDGDLYGASVSGFTKLSNRIDLGKRLADILLSPELYHRFYQFAKQTEHTGSRVDYERYLKQKHLRDTPFLRTTYPVISHHIHEHQDWSEFRKIKKAWYKPIHHKRPIFLTDWYIEKQKQMRTLIGIEEMFK